MNTQGQTQSVFQSNRKRPLLASCQRLPVCCTEGESVPDCLLCQRSVGVCVWISWYQLTKTPVAVFLRLCHDASRIGSKSIQIKKSKKMSRASGIRSRLRYFKKSHWSYRDNTHSTTPGGSMCLISTQEETNHSFFSLSFYITQHIQEN